MNSRSPFRRRRLHTQSKEAQSGLVDDDFRHVQRCIDDDNAHRVRYNMGQDNSQSAGPAGTRSLYIVRFSQVQYLRSNESHIVSKECQRQCDNQIGEISTQGINYRHGKQQIRYGHENIQGTHNDTVNPTAVISGDSTQKTAYYAGCHSAQKRDSQGNFTTVKYTGKDISSIRIAAEPVLR